MIKFLKTFFSRSFIIFCIIGAINTLVHLSIFNLVLRLPTVIANTIAFIIASIFSYWANTTFTYKIKMNHSSFIASMFTFILKLLVSNALTLGFEWLLIRNELTDLIKLIPIPVTLIILPLQFLVFNQIFKTSKVESPSETSTE
jgi:putative flippase GtrA